MNWIQKNFKKIIYIAFLVPILTVAGVSISHVTSWYGLSNPFSWAIYLSVGIEIAALSALAAISAKMGRKVYFPFGIVTLIQFIGNIFFAYQYIDVNSLEFKNWIDLVDPVVSYLGVESGDPVGHKRFLALFAGGMLPIISLSFLHMLVKFEEEEKKVEPIFDIDEISIEAGKKEAEIEKEKYTPTQEDLERLEKELIRVNEQKFGSLIKEIQEEPIEDPEIKRLSYTRRDA
jgi:phosphoglycerol transferase MdoB-like AlkP superfamily enzyme